MAPDTRTTATDQASTILQDLQNGAADNYGADGRAEDLNGLETSFQEELEDPAALLESLASYEPPQSPVVGSRASAASNDHDHFESLLQAAATAEGVDAAEEDRSQRSFDPFEKNNKRKRNEQDEAHQPDSESSMLVRDASKRRKKVPEEDADQLALERELWGPEEGENEGSMSTPERHISPVPTADARAVGLHSATALFRRPSTASKKYTRAPMSKLFTSLELTAEQFLSLQSAAKAYMLDPNHPERGDCVGSRGRGDTDMVKLKLFACVKSFLEDEGWGARCFTEEIIGGKLRKLKWPQMKNKIISLVTPLMRRMVTNERQRLYALETRQEKRSKSDPARQGHCRKSQTPTSEITLQPEFRRKSVTSNQQSPVDPKLNDYHYTINDSYQPNGHAQPDGALKEPGPSIQEGGGESSVDVVYLVNLMHHGRRLHPQVTLRPSACPGFVSLLQHIHNLTGGLSQEQQPSSIKVLGPTGLVNVYDEETWRGAIASVLQTEWMDGEVKFVIQVVDRDS
ncbi:hypothetical protein BKA64DRAFT_190817 [Cadophora sp. MPI-SDFR-AT-0126]|nr:hypothetical protein BKA64DRAFT_190817 [Leotiomycetes sp. MPI-SDFR-AT-0126]